MNVWKKLGVDANVLFMLLAQLSEIHSYVPFSVSFSI